MEHNTDVQQLIDDLVYVKKAIAKNTNALKLINLGGLLSRVILGAGIVTILLSGAAYLLIREYGSFDLIPAHLRGILLALTAAFVAITGISKIYSLLSFINRENSNMTVRKLIMEIYTPRALHILIPYVTSIILTTVFLVTNQHTLYLVPALAILTGLLCLAYVNVFYIKELIITGDWLLATGLLSLFFTGSLHPLLALIITFGLGFCIFYPANKYLERHQ